MFIKNYVKDYYWNLIYDNYDEEYLLGLNKDNFEMVYRTLVDNNFYFIDDVILNYLELFEINSKSIEKALNEIKELIGDKYVFLIGKDLSLLNKIMDLALSFEGEDYDEEE